MASPGASSKRRAVSEQEHTRGEWESRADSYGDSPTGVLFKGLSDSANGFIHAWHEGILRKVFLPLLPQGARVLDLGCGYGRMAIEAKRARPDVRIVGQDLAHRFCRLFDDHAGPVVQAGIEAIPFAEGTFDAVMAVTSLMYVAPASRRSALRGISRVVRDGGHVWIVDPGLELQKLLAFVRRRSAGFDGIGVAMDDYARLAAGSGLEFLLGGANPALTARLLVPGLREGDSAWKRRALRSAVDSDIRMGHDARWSLHRWALMRVPRASS